MKRRAAFVAASALCAFMAVNTASADMVRGIDIAFVTIENAGNIPDTVSMVSDGTTGYGSVGYEYQIGTLEITNSQWNTFVSTVGAPTGSDGYFYAGEAYDRSAYYVGAQQPMTCVSWYEAAQFCNYLTSGDKSLGAYLFSGDNTNPGGFLGVDRASAVSAYGIAYVLPTEDEWYKAAYYKPDGTGYSLYANGTDVAPIAGVDARYGGYTSVWDVGTGSMEQNGTFDMMGNVIEWTETLAESDAARHIRGGQHGSDSTILLPSHNNWDLMSSEIDNIGFRVAVVDDLTVVPLPGAALLGVLGLSVAGYRLRKERA